MGLEGKPVVVVGLARSGIAAARFLAGRGSAVVATDRKPQAELPEEVLKLAEIGVRLELGGHRAESLAGAGLVVVSPGVPWQAPELVAARAAGVPVIGELELGVRYIKGPVAAITGTKGKSTTTAALGAMLREAGRDVRVGGNIGEAVTGLLEGATEDTAFVLEVSSFQLESHRLPPSEGRRLPEPVRRPSRPPRQLRGIRGGQGADLLQPDRGRLRGGERRTTPR